MGVGTVTGADIIGGFTGFNAESFKKAARQRWMDFAPLSQGLALSAVEQVDFLALALRLVSQEERSLSQKWKLLLSIGLRQGVFI